MFLSTVTVPVSTNVGIGAACYPEGHIECGNRLLDWDRAVAKADAGATNPDGSVSFSGSGALDMGDGALPVTVPFSATVTPSGLQLTIGTTALPTQLLSAGSIFIE